MNKPGLLFAELHEAETDLAREFRKVAERQAADHGTHYPCRTFANQCDSHAEHVRGMAQPYHRELSEPHRAETLIGALGAARHKTSELIGRRPAAGLVLLRDLRHLFLAAQAVNVHWILLGQVAQAARDQDLLTQVSSLHKETLTQIKWLKTRLKDASPQILTVTE